MADPRTKFTLTDSEGNPHKYEVFFLQPTEALPLALEILALGAGPMLRLIERSMDLQDADQAESALANMDFGSIADDIRLSVASLQKKPQLVRQLFDGVLRDDKDLTSDVLYNQAYAGNWGEWYQALFQVVKANGFLSFFGSLSRTSGEKS